MNILYTSPGSEYECWSPRDFTESNRENMGVARNDFITRTIMFHTGLLMRRDVVIKHRVRKV